jgi:hypothetical protein
MIDVIERIIMDTEEVSIVFSFVHIIVLFVIGPLFTYWANTFRFKYSVERLLNIEWFILCKLIFVLLMRVLLQYNILKLSYKEGVVMFLCVHNETTLYFSKAF